MTSTVEQIICGGLTFEKTAVELREKVAFRASQIPAARLGTVEIRPLVEITDLPSTTDAGT